jgi:methyl-accepting chemotaxis protein
MNSDNVRLVQQSWKEVIPIAPRAAELFYQNLFSLDPGLKPLFRGDMTAQGDKLMQMIGAAVGKLHDLDTLLPILQNLGKRHAGYGVKDHHYESVAAALLATLSQGLGARFTPDVKQAWIRVYDLIATTMMAAAHAESGSTQSRKAHLPERDEHALRHPLPLPQGALGRL